MTTLNSSGVAPTLHVIFYPITCCFDKAASFPGMLLLHSSFQIHSLLTILKISLKSIKNKRSSNFPQEWTIAWLWKSPVPSHFGLHASTIFFHVMVITKEGTEVFSKFSVASAIRIVRYAECGRMISYRSGPRVDRCYLLCICTHLAQSYRWTRSSLLWRRWLAFAIWILRRLSIASRFYS